ncbi:MAG: hypothetical protein TEF_12580 [Rhizobiales bacterium NRL2]|jgi:hypothetical protein|nr:MAG: hypothetical protein TEF_03985 [Rhizobiales bacterium NRL2]ANK81533.1 MAG: hypothetical protein TEF_12580 [Rhizobiales bacterium NRL2]
MNRQSSKVIGPIALLAALVLGACVTGSTEPPEGATLYQKQPLPVGTTMTLRRSEGGNVRTFTQTVTGTDIFEGREVIRSENDDGTTSFYDRETRTWTATLDRDGTVKTYIDPHAGYYDWPLFVGKSWRPSYAFHDVAGGNSWSGIAPSLEVAAIETVTVPAGTFETLRIESGPGNNVGFEATYWYAPSIGLIVKSDWARTTNHYQGPGGARETVLVAFEKPSGPDVELIE